MKKTIICGISLNPRLEAIAYKSDDGSIPTSEEAVRYPINGFLRKTLSKDDDLKIILLAKKDEFTDYKENLEYFTEEFKKVNTVGAKYEVKAIKTDFDQEKGVYRDELLGLIEEIPAGSDIYTDATYGSKDVPVIIFTALTFAERFLRCNVKTILYGKVNFINHEPVNPTLCDMTSLFYFNSINNLINCSEPEKAREMMKKLLSV